MVYQVKHPCTLKDNNLRALLSLELDQVDKERERSMVLFYMYIFDLPDTDNQSIRRCMPSIVHLSGSTDHLDHGSSSSQYRAKCPYLKSIRSYHIYIYFVADTKVDRS